MAHQSSNDYNPELNEDELEAPTAGAASQGGSAVADEAAHAGDDAAADEVVVEGDNVAATDTSAEGDAAAAAEAGAAEPETGSDAAGPAAGAPAGPVPGPAADAPAAGSVIGAADPAAPGDAPASDESAAAAVTVAPTVDALEPADSGELPISAFIDPDEDVPGIEMPKVDPLEPQEDEAASVHKVRNVILIVLAVLLVLAGVWAFALYRSASSVKASAASALAQAKVIKSSIANGDADGLTSAVSSISSSIHAIDNELSSPLWGAATFVPVLGQDVKSAQQLADAATELADDALVPIANDLAGTSLSSLVTDGTVNVELVTRLCNDCLDAFPSIESSLNTINSLPEANIPQLRQIMNKLTKPITDSGVNATQLRSLFENLPRMLGSEGPRTYLIIAQNNAELRPTGGLPGAWGTITFDNGTISLGEFSTILHGDFQVEVTDEEHEATGTNLDLDPAQVNCTADFTRVGQLSRDYWWQAKEQSVDGVVAIDPVFLQRIVGLTGGFNVDGYDVTGENCAQLLMHDAYIAFPSGNDSDEFFAHVADAAFSSVMNNLGSVDVEKLAEVIGESGADYRLLAWMANETEQQMVVDCGFSGGLQTDITKPQLGFYISDDTYSKISWYATWHTTIGDSVQNSDGTTTYSVRSEYTNTLSLEEAETLPTYITGTNENKRDKADSNLFLYIYTPLGGTISDIQISGDGLLDESSEIPVNPLSGCQVARMRVHTGGGATTTVNYKITVPAEATERLTVRTTPIANEALL